MPEGDTIHRIAASLAPRLTGKALERVTTQGLARDVAGQTVMHVAAHGKHLVIELDSGAYLRAHLGMNGRFRAYNRAGGEAMLAKLWIGAPTIEISHRRHPQHGMAMATLGPDVLAGDFDGRIAAARAAEQGARSIADILLDQRIVAGIGTSTSARRCSSPGSIRGRGSGSSTRPRSRRSTPGRAGSCARSSGRREADRHRRSWCIAGPASRARVVARRFPVTCSVILRAGRGRARRANRHRHVADSDHAVASRPAGGAFTERASTVQNLVVRVLVSRLL